MIPLARNLVGRTAIVTGSSSGNGRAIAFALAKAGVNVVCSDRRAEQRPEGYEEDHQPTHLAIQSKYRAKSIYHQCDVQHQSQIRSLVRCAVGEFGRLDIMVNNAGIFTGLKTILDCSEEEYDATMAVNAKGTYLGCKYAIEQFLSQAPCAASAGGESHSIGKIINIASMGGIIGLMQEPAYCASKGAVVNLTRQLAIDFGKKGVNVNAVCPGFMATAMVRPFLEDPGLKRFLDESTPWPVLGTAEDVANATIWLASPGSDFMTGSILTIDGGFTAR
ncbi:hypothetical protein CLAIMM_04246 [Cladophialophora immunda]|nr:hypothetical protein CLAIMM_04246 [Cladophialophora immunda]